MAKQDIRIRATIGKWGNSAAVRLPATLLAQANISSQQPIDLVLSDGKIILEPIQSPEFELNELLSKISPDNIHQEIDYGPSVGKEVF